LICGEISCPVAGAVEWNEPPPLSGKMPTAVSFADVTAAIPESRSAYRALVREKAASAGLPADIADAVAEVESGYNTNASGAAGEVGLMQVMPATARMLGFSGSNADLAKPQINVHYGVTYLARAWQLAGGNICTATMKYRAGHGETRFSYRSVDYCVRVRAILQARGYPVTGTVPLPTFGESTISSGARGRSRLFARGGPNLNSLNIRLQATANAAFANAATFKIR
jgi:hypothetical protein